MTKKKNMFGLSVKTLPSTKHVHFKCLLNQGSKALEPPRTHQARVEWGCYCCTSSTSPHQKKKPLLTNYSNRILVIYFFLAGVCFSEWPMHVLFHMYKKYNPFSMNTAQNPRGISPCSLKKISYDQVVHNKSQVSHPSHGSRMGVPLDFPHWTWRIAGDEGPKNWLFPYLCKKNICCANMHTSIHFVL